MKELIEKLRCEAEFDLHHETKSYLIAAANAIDRLENELLAATLRIDNDALVIAQLRGELALWFNPDRSVIREMATLVAERDALALVISQLKANLQPYESRKYAVITDEQGLVLEEGKYHKWEDEDGIDWEWFGRDVDCNTCIDVSLVRADKLVALVAERDEWKARCEFSFQQRDNLEKVIDGLTREQIGLKLDAARLEWAMNNMSQHNYTLFGMHVMSVGGTGDIHDCRTFIDSMKGCAE